MSAKTTQAKKAKAADLIAKARAAFGEFDRDRAAKHLKRAVDSAPTDVDTILNCGQHYSMLDRHELALGLFLKAVKIAPANAVGWYNLSATHRFLGNAADAERAIDKAISLDDTNFEAYFLRSDLRKASETSNHLAEIRARLERGVPAGKSRAFLQYAIAKEFDDLGRFDDAFEYFAMGARSRRDSFDYSIDNDERIFAQIAHCYDAEFLNRDTAGFDEANPVFILGMPRTGTTLLERILSSHSSVVTAGERTEFSTALTRATLAGSGADYLKQHGIVKASLQADFKSMGKRYAEMTRAFRQGDAAVIDKLPFNFLYVGLIRRALPNAKIIHVVRDPMDTCFAVFRMLFAKAYPFSYDLDEIARYYIAYRKLMAHWNDMVSTAMHTIAYEDLVADTEAETRRVFDYLNLEFESECLELDKNRGSVTTASASQVRQGVYSSSVQKWRRYESHLGPLYDQLNKAGVLTWPG